MHHSLSYAVSWHWASEVFPYRGLGQRPLCMSFPHSLPPFHNQIGFAFKPRALLGGLARAVQSTCWRQPSADRAGSQLLRMILAGCSARSCLVGCR
jgi:hypothetical protein